MSDDIAAVVDNEVCRCGPVSSPITHAATSSALFDRVEGSEWNCVRSVQAQARRVAVLAARGGAPIRLLMARIGQGRHRPRGLLPQWRRLKKVRLPLVLACGPG